MGQAAQTVTVVDKIGEKSLESVTLLGVSPGDGTLIEAYLQTLAAENMAAGSIRLQRHYLHKLATSRGGTLMLTTMTEDDLVAWLSNPNWGPEARKSARSTIRSFYAWAHRRGLIDENPAAYLRPIRVPSGRPRPVPEDMMRTALANCDGDEQTVMVLLASYAGLRVSEIAGLRTDTITPYGLRVTGKGSKTRMIPVHPLILAPLSALIARVGGDWVFPSPVRDGHVGYDYAYKRIKAVLPKGFTPHQLRHRFATQAYRGTKDLRAVQELLGHTSPNTTVRYTLIEDEALTAAVCSVA
jgi:integrase/recombinase XerC